jgi:hypothetical protein
MEKHRLKVFEIRALWRIFGPMREKVAGGWRRLHNGELHNLYASLSVIRVMKSRSERGMVHVERFGEMKNAHKIMVGKPERKRHFGRTSRR